MKKDIIIVGAGHGGLVAGSKLAKNGFNVKIYERNAIGKISWDWRDNMDPHVFNRINIQKPDSSIYVIPESFNFISPNHKNKLVTNVPVEKRHISIERRALIEYLIKLAISNGVEINYEINITAPIIKDGKIIGIKSNDSEIFGDLIIDSAGINTPIKYKLPESYGLSKEIIRGEQFYTYRAYFKKECDETFWDVILGYYYKRGIAWVNTSNEYSDVLIGCIDPFEKGELDQLLKDLRTKYPCIGEELLRGGQIAPIPIRRTAPMLVGPNYAVIGDAAYMTIPINGSGIDNSMVAGDILADTIIEANKNTLESYETSILWPYQWNYYNEIGAKNSFIECVKDFLICLTDFNDVDFLFEKRIFKAEDIEASVTGKELKIGILDLMGRAFRGISRLGTLLDLAKSMKKGRAVLSHHEKLPKKYVKQKVSDWIIKYESFFELFYTKLTTILIGK